LPSTFHMLVALAIACVIGIALVSFLFSHANIDTNKSSSSTLRGEPTISANFINTVLDYYNSPAVGKGQALYDDGVKYDIDPAYALAFFMQESTLGTKGVATVTHSLGNIRAIQGYPQYDGYRKYATWEEGFENWYELISQQYINTWGLTTIDQIIPVYAPNSDNNNEQQYINAIKSMVQSWRSGEVNISSIKQGPALLAYNAGPWGYNYSHSIIKVML
jgi:Mannosyl-glycoprotein endo-beta-N-acetylglucosaminidase